MGIRLGSGILLDLMLFADHTNAEPKSNRSILWELDRHGRFAMNWNNFECMCFVLAICLKIF